MNNPHKIICALAFIIFLSAFPIPSALGEGSVLPTQTIITTSIPPYTKLTDGTPGGLIVELVQAMSKRMGMKANIEFMPWKRALKNAQTLGQKNPPLIIPLNRSAEREKKFSWIVELYVDKTLLVSRKSQDKNIPPIKDLKIASRLRTGVLAGSPLEAQLKRAGFLFVDPAINEETNAKKLFAGRIDLWHVARLVAPYVTKSLALDPKTLQYGLALDKNDLYLAAPADFSESQRKKWWKAYRSIKNDGTLKRIIAKYQ